MATRKQIETVAPAADKKKALEAALEAAFDRENDPVRGADLARRLLFIVKFLQDARRASA